jgi:hypothetical protein
MNGDYFASGIGKKPPFASWSHRRTWPQKHQKNGLKFHSEFATDRGEIDLVFQQDCLVRRGENRSPSGGLEPPGKRRGRRAKTPVLTALNTCALKNPGSKSV